jgi:hypothetical protein
MTTDMLPPEPKKTSPWVWVGVGCAGILVLCVIVAGLAVYVVGGKIRNFGKQFEDPTVREARVKEVLGAQEIPEGYHAFMTFSVPWLLDVAILTDREFVKTPKGSGSNTFDKWGFVYIRMPHHQKDEKLQEYLDGKRSPDELLQGRDMHFHPRDTVGRGTVQGEGGVSYRYIATRGEVQMRREVKQGITTVIGVECPNDQKFRMGIWFGPDPTAKPEGGEAGAAPTEEGKTGSAGPAFAGSPADEAAIKEFMDHFALCQQ